MNLSELHKFATEVRLESFPSASHPSCFNTLQLLKVSHFFSCEATMAINGALSALFVKFIMPGVSMWDRSTPGIN